MQLGLRHTIKKGPANLTLAKTGLSASIKVANGVRIRVGTNGRVHVSCGFHGLRLMKSVSLKKLLKLSR